jgi:hypothetical protein
MKNILLSLIFLTTILAKNNAHPDTTKVKMKSSVVQIVDNSGGTEIKVGEAESEPVNVIPDTIKVKKGSSKIVHISDTYEGTEVVVGRNGNIIVDERDDTVRIKIGGKGIKITDTYDGTNVEILDRNDLEKEFKDFNFKRHFRGHWAGFELGMNNYLTPSWNFTNSFLALNPGKSWNVNINFMQYSINLSKKSNIGLVTGLGFQMNDYKFSRNSSITKDENDNIVEVPFDVNLSMSKFHANYLTLPLIAEFHLNADKYGRRVYIGAGLIGSFKLWSYTKIKYHDPGKVKAKDYSDLSINPWQYAATFRIGFKAIKLFMNYNLNSLFMKGRAETLYPISIGFVLLSF